MNERVSDPKNYTDTDGQQQLGQQTYVYRVRFKLYSEPLVLALVALSVPPAPSRPSTFSRWTRSRISSLSMTGTMTASSIQGIWNIIQKNHESINNLCCICSTVKRSFSLQEWMSHRPRLSRSRLSKFNYKFFFKYSFRCDCIFGVDSITHWFFSRIPYLVPTEVYPTGYLKCRWI
jgi:hypothetical protein